MKLLIRWLIIVCALYIAAWAVPGIRVSGDAWVAYGVTAAVLGLINAFLRPLLRLLSCPLILLTLGFFLLVINALTLWLASYLAQNWFEVGFYVDGFGSAFWGALIVSVVSVILSGIVKEKEKKK
ncbi:MAG: phage holin family protein [bacterium]|nr:phage holin family protein [bacterium]